MKVFWTDTAVKHLSGIYAYIAQNSPQYARRMVDRLTRRSEQISKFLCAQQLFPKLHLKPELGLQPVQEQKPKLLHLLHY